MHFHHPNPGERRTPPGRQTCSQILSLADDGQLQDQTSHLSTCFNPIAQALTLASKACVQCPLYLHLYLKSDLVNRSARVLCSTTTP